MFRIPCEVVEVVIVSKVVANQFRAPFNAAITCIDGTSYATNMLDVGYSDSSAYATSYVLCNGFDIRGRNAVLLKQIIKRATSIVVEKHLDKVSILYSI